MGDGRNFSARLLIHPLELRYQRQRSTTGCEVFRRPNVIKANENYRVNINAT